MGKAVFSAPKDSYVIASQCAHWRGNPHPLTHLDDETAKKGERIATPVTSVTGSQ